MSTNFWKQNKKSSNVLPLRLKQTFPPKIWIFTEGDGIKSRLPFKIFSTFQAAVFSRKCMEIEKKDL